MEDIRSWVKEKFLAKILIMSSYEANFVLSQSNLTPEELLQPFCDISHSFSVKSLTKSLSFTNYKIKVFEKLELKRNESILSSLTPKVNWHETLNISGESIQNYVSEDHTP